MPFIIFGIVLILLSALFFAATYIPFRIAFYNSKKSKKHFSDPTLPLSGEEYAAYNDDVMASVDRVLKIPYEDVYITSNDGLRLHGRYFHNCDGYPVEIFFHGYRSSGLRDGSGSIELGPEAGFNLITVDQRGSGLSDGNVISFGIKEKYDVLSWIDYVTERFGKDQKIILSGVSMGTATVLMASGLDLPENVKCITADCGFSSQKEIIAKVAKEMGFPPKLVMPLIKIGAKLYGGFDLDSETPLEAVSRTKVPVFFAHGAADGFVPCEMTLKMYDACRSDKVIFIAQDTAHGLSFVAKKKEYCEALSKFFAKHGISDSWKDNF